MQEYLRSKSPLFTPEELGERADLAAGIAREASSVERAVKGYWTATYFARERAASPRKLWTALLLRWQRVVRPVDLGRVLLSDRECVVKVHAEVGPAAGLAAGGAFAAWHVLIVVWGQLWGCWQ